MWRRLVLGVGLGVPFGVIAVVMVVPGAVVGVDLVQIMAFDVRCRAGGPDVLGIWRICGGGLARDIPLAAGVLGLVLLGMYGGLVVRWIRGLPPRGEWSGMWLVGRVLAGGFVGLSALAGGTALYVHLNNRYLHFGCFPLARGEWMCEGNIYYWINPVVALLALALVVMHPILWIAAERGVDHGRFDGP